MRQFSLAAFDAVLFAATLALVAIGVLFIYSSGVNESGVVVSREFIRQIVWAATGIILLLFLAFFNYSNLRNLALYLYAANILLLLVTLAIGRQVNGARSWLGIGELGVQPSEFAKITTILFLATYLTGIGNGIREVPRFVLGLLIVLVPVGLILLQPDMGTALVFFPIFLIMAYVGGAQGRHLFFIIAIGFLTIILAASPSLASHGSGGGALMGLLSDSDFMKYLLLASVVVAGLGFLGWRSLRRRYFYWIFWGAAVFMLSAGGSILLRLVLKDYQIMRLVIFVNPKLDPQGAGWNIIQSTTAIGSGGLFGKGFLQGTQSHYRFLPQQSTDFLFSILAEEWGFLGALLVFGLFLLILMRGISIVWASREDYATLVGAGILAMIFFHVVVNVGMAMGIMPVTGITLLFLSYGGSSLWSGLVAIGILMNIGRRRLRY